MKIAGRVMTEMMKEVVPEASTEPAMKIAGRVC